MNQNIFLFVQENQFTNYSKEGGDKFFITPLYKALPKRPEKIVAIYVCRSNN
jgi:hypothetical protein